MKCYVPNFGLFCFDPSKILGFIFHVLHRWRDFKFIVPVNAFMAVECTMAGSM